MELAQAFPVAARPQAIPWVVHLAQVHSVQDQFLEDFLDNNSVVYTVEPLAIRLLEASSVSAPLPPLDKQDFPPVELEATLAMDHWALAPLMELEATAPRADQVSDSLVSEHQTVFPDQAPDLEAQA